MWTLPILHDTYSKKNSKKTLNVSIASFPLPTLSPVTPPPSPFSPIFIKCPPFLWSSDVIRTCADFHISTACPRHVPTSHPIWASLIHQLSPSWRVVADFSRTFSVTLPDMSSLPSMPVSNPNPNTLTCLNIVDLPDDVILRILAQIGNVDDQIAIGYKLASLCSRFRQLLQHHFLPSITTIRSTSLNALCLGRPAVVRQALTSFFSCTTHLRELNLAGCSALLSPECFTAISNAATSTLTVVNLAHCQLTDACLAPLLKCAALKQLELPSCHDLTGVVFRPEICKSPLRLLNLSWVQTLSREGIHAISTLTTVRILMVTGCDIMWSQSLLTLASSNLRLSLAELRLSSSFVYEEDIYQFLHASPKMKTLVLARSSNAYLWAVGGFAMSGIERLRASFPKVTIKIGV